MYKKRKSKTPYIHMFVAGGIFIGSLAFFSVSFGLKEHTRRARAPITAPYNTTKEQQNTNNGFTLKNTSEATEPKYVLQQLERLGVIRARSFLVGDLDTGEIIFERRPHTQYPIASITKYFTAYTAAKVLDPFQIANITKEVLRTNGNRGQLLPKHKLSTRDLLYPLLLVSSNDAGEIISRQSDRESFIKSMNSSSRLNGLSNTSFADPTGLSKLNISTARDLFQMMRLVRDEYPEIVGISKLDSKRTETHTWRNINKASRFPEFQGGKTGYTNAARQTSIGYYQIKLANNQTKNLGIVILQSNTRQQDTRNILDYIKRYVAYLK